MIDPRTAAIYRMRRRKVLPAFAAILLYPFLLEWLWTRSAHPESFGVRPGLGKGGVYLRWWDSYLLLERHHPWDIITFVVMWPGVIALISWSIRLSPKTKAITVDEDAAYAAHEKSDAA